MKGRVTVIPMLGLVAALGCSDSRSPMSPEAVEPQAALLSGLTSLLIAPVERNEALATDVTWSFTVGALGGTSSNAATGLAIVVPAYAVTSPTTITVKALAGKAIAYEFQPHGLEFRKQVTLSQNIRGTTLDGLLASLVPVSGAYFNTSGLQLEGGLAVVTEVIPASLNLLSRRASFPIEHFSGYILASGRSSSRDRDSGE